MLFAPAFGVACFRVRVGLCVRRENRNALNRSRSSSSEASEIDMPKSFIVAIFFLSESSVVLELKFMVEYDGYELMAMSFQSLDDVVYYHRE